MGIPESQLEVWAKQGSITQSSDTYQPVKRALESPSAKYAGTAYEVFLQGSYGNDTNIRAESDVDIVIRSDASFFYDLAALGPNEKTAFSNSFSGDNVVYGYSAFKADVVSALKDRFGSDVEEGKKAVRIKSNGSRRNADVVIAVELRRYTSFPNLADSTYHPGICFFDSAGNRIENFPERHSGNSTAKHAATSYWYKPCVRILKNMRTKLVNDGELESGTAPSYFIEGLLYNAPNDKFGKNYVDTITDSINWLLKADRSDFVTPSGLHWLLKDRPECWPAANCDRFLKAIVKLWNNS